MIFGGQFGLGVGQKWQSLAASRLINTFYTNSTGKPIMVGVEINCPTTAILIASGEVFIYTRDTLATEIRYNRVKKAWAVGDLLTLNTLVLPNHVYSLQVPNTLSLSIAAWYEAR